MDVITELKQNYAALAELLTDTIGSDYDDALSGYIAACLMKIWSGNKLYAPEYAKAIGCVLGREPSMEQCLTALSCCGDESRKLDVPALFHQLVACDLPRQRLCRRCGQNQCDRDFQEPLPDTKVRVI